jgi:type I restriction enzyme, S subunit
MSDELEFPKSWETCLMGEIAEIIGGGTPPSKDPANFTASEGIPWITPADLSGYKEMFIKRGTRSLTERGFAESSARKITAGSVLFSSRAPIGYIAIAENELTTSQGFKSFVLSKGIDSKFVYFYLRHIKPIAESMATGTTFKELSGASAAKLPFLLPPLEEQKRIAEKLEKLLARVDIGLEHLNRVPDILKRFRQAVVAAATSGELTREWREANKIELNWEDAQLSDICSSITDGDHQAPPQVKTGIPFITISAISDGRLNLDKASRFVSKEYFDSLKDNRKPTLGDVLFSVTGSIAIPALVDIEEVFTFQRHIAILKPDNTRVLSKFLLYTLSTENIKQQALQIATGTAQLTIPLSGLRSFTVSLPSLEEQAEIVKRVEELFAFVDALETRYKLALAHFERLTPTILAKAFRGELVTQDSNDERASVLLERIRMAREAEEAIKKNSKPSPRKEKIMKAKPVKAVTELSELIDRLGGEVLPDRLLVESALEDNVDFFFELLREGRDKNILEVPVGRSDAIRRMVHADR